VLQLAKDKYKDEGGRIASGTAIESTSRDVAAAIAPGNLAAFPPSLEVNAAYA